MREIALYGWPLDGVPLTDMSLPEVETSLDAGGGSGVAVAMSGGVDSSLVAALLAERGRDVQGFTIAWGEEDRARRMARALGVDLEVVECPPGRYGEWIARCADEYPRHNPAYAVVAGAAARCGHSHLFSGEGGDEFFVGYTRRYRRMMKYMRVPGKRFLAPLLALYGLAPGRLSTYAKRLRAATSWHRFYSRWASRLPSIGYEERLEPWTGDDWMQATVDYEARVKMPYYVGTVSRLVETMGVEMVFPLLGLSRAEGWRECWDGESRVGKAPLLRALKRIAGREAYRIAMEPPHGFTPPPMSEVWRAGLGDVVERDSAPVPRGVSDLVDRASGAKAEEAIRVDAWCAARHYAEYGGVD